MPVCAGGIQDNLSTSTAPGMDNPDCTGQNMYYALGPQNGLGNWSTGTPGSLTGITTLSVNTTSCTGTSSNPGTAFCSITASGSPQLLELLNGYVAPGIAVTVDTGANQETVTTLSGQNVIGMLGVFTKNHTASIAVSYNVGAFTLANGTNTNTSNYNYVQYMPSIVCTASSGCSPIWFCGVNGIGQPCGASTLGPDHWEIADLNLSIQPGNNETTGGVIYFNAASGQIPVSAFASHNHIRRDFAHGDWTSLDAGANNATDVINLSGCYYCSVVDSQTSQMLRPSTEGHSIYDQGNAARIENNWLEGQSSGLFTGGDSNPPIPVTFLGGSDSEIRGNRMTFPYSWLGFQCVLNGSNTNGNQTGTSGCYSIPSNNATYAGVNYVRKNAIEFKTCNRCIVTGNIFENVDNGGGQRGPVRLLNVRNASGNTNDPTNYNSIITNVYECDNILRNACEGRQDAARSDGLSNGNGVAFGLRNINLCDELDYNISNNNPGCGSSADGITLGASNQIWTGNITCPDPAHCTFVATNSVDGAAPLSTASNTVSSVTINSESTAAITLTAAANASGGTTVYTGTITGGGSNALAGQVYNVAGFDNTLNNGLFTATASSTTTLTLNNSAGVSDTHAGTATGRWTVNETAGTNPFVVNEHIVNTGLSNASDSGCLNELQLIVTTAGNPFIAAFPSTATTGCTAGGPFSDTGNVYGPVGYNVLDVVTGDPFYVSGCTTTFFNGSGTTIGAHTVAGLGYTVTSGSASWGSATGVGGLTVPDPADFTVTFALSNSGQSDTSGTCTVTNLQGNPVQFNINHMTFVTDSDTVLGTGPTLSSLSTTGSPPLFPCTGLSTQCGSGQIHNHLLTNSILFSQNGATQAGLYNTVVGEGSATQQENFDTSSLTFDYLVWVGRSTKQGNYYEIGNNPNFADPNGCKCTGSGCLPNGSGSLPNCQGGTSGAPSLFFPSNSCTAIGLVNSCGSSTVPLQVSDYHGYALTTGSTYHNAASDSTDIGARIPNIDSAQTVNTFPCPYSCTGPGPFPK
jgi:hypothetical protein